MIDSPSASQESQPNRVDDERFLIDTLNTIGQAVAGEHDLHRLVQAVVDGATKLIGAQFGSFFYNITTDRTEALKLYALSGAPREAFSSFPLPRNTPLFEPSFRGTGVVRCDDVTRDPRYGQFKSPFGGMPPGHLPVRSYLSAPVISRSGSVLGTLLFGHETVGVFTERHERLIVGIAAQAAVGIDNARLVEELTIGHERMEVVLRGAEIGLWYCPLPFDRLIWDDRVKAHFHLPRDTEVTIDLFYERIHPDDRQRTREAIEKSISERSGYDINYRTLSSDGARTHWIRAIGRGFYDESGEPTRFDGITVNVTDRVLADQALRTSEARLRAVVEATPEAVKIVARDGSLMYMNPAGIRMIEAETMEAVQGASVPMIISIEHRADWLARHERVCAGEKLSWEFEIVGMGGTRRWMETHAVPLPLPDGNVAQLAVTREITARRAAEADHEQLLARERAARTEAERASRMKDEFLATLSHELRTPLNAILGWSQILNHSNADLESQREGLATIERNAKSQRQIIDDLLDMSRIISGTIRLDVQRVDIPEVIRAAIETVRHAADAKQIRIVTVLDPKAGLVRGDPGRLQQVLWNLLSNAIKFTPRGGKLQILLQRVHSYLEISVVDNGEGIRPDFIGSVFERFRQADASTTRLHGGLGLGLAIVKQLVELHGGTVRAESPGPGKGSTFVVSLPVTVIHPSESADRSAAGDATEASGNDSASSAKSLASATANPLELHHDLGGVRVLIVDDEPDARALLKRLLEDGNATVLTAENASHAYQHVQDDQFDLLISDIGMPGEDGYSFIRRIRAIDDRQISNIPAIALTAYARSEDRTRAVVAGFNSHLAKPVDPAELLAIAASLTKRLRTR